MNIQYCICCERNLRIYRKMLFCKPCNYLYYIDTDITPISDWEIQETTNHAYPYPENFKSDEQVFRCCKFIGFTSKCCDPLENIEIKENEPTHKSENESNYFDINTINCWYELEGCYAEANTLYWKNSYNKIIKHTI